MVTDPEHNEASSGIVPNAIEGDARMKNDEAAGIPRKMVLTKPQDTIQRAIEHALLCNGIVPDDSR